MHAYLLNSRDYQWLLNAIGNYWTAPHGVWLESPWRIVSDCAPTLIGSTLE